MSKLIARRRSVTNAPPALSPFTAPSVSAPLIGETTPLTEATATASQVPVSSTSSVSVQSLSARRPHRHRRDLEPSVHTSSSSRVEDGGSQPAKKKTRGPNRMLKTAQNVRLSASLIKIAYDSRHRGAATSQQHSIVATSCGCVIWNCCPMQWETWAQIPQETKILVRDKLSVNFDFKDISPEVITYLDETFANRYKNWKSDLHAHFKKFNDPEVARLEGCPSELEHRPEDWEWLCNHFTDSKFVKKSVAGKIARDSKTLLHHSGSKPFSYNLETRRQEGSKFPEIDVFKDVYVRPGNEIAEQLHATMVEKGDAVLQEATSQLPLETPMEDVTLPEDVGFQIMTEVLDQKYGRRHGKVVRGIGKARVRETGASSSKSTTGEANALKEEVTTLKGQLAAQDEQIKAQSEQMRAQSEHIKAENEQMRAENEQMRAQMSMIVQALAVSGLQIQLPAPDLTPPSTSQPPHLPDTQ
ncbi:uncharacterized protein LOC125476079 [Pyrus x bretschneideri]|uniref:uncharacterized protein LOC125476079 n=1 Tax=Pyrus x bretschneideri TaxID=225117 RepID=UPI00202DE1EF|nr:uncharacterized protein LOC125476079 [Pyrus x bretschneideri]